METAAAVGWFLKGLFLSTFVVGLVFYSWPLLRDPEALRILPTWLNSSFRGSSLQGADFRSSRLAWCRFDTCDLRCADFSFAVLHHCDFRHARLAGARFAGADLTGCDLRGATGVAEADFTEAILADVLWDDLPAR